MVDREFAFYVCDNSVHLRRLVLDWIRDLEMGKEVTREDRLKQIIDRRDQLELELGSERVFDDYRWLLTELTAAWQREKILMTTMTRIGGFDDTHPDEPWSFREAKKAIAEVGEFWGEK